MYKEMTIKITPEIIDWIETSKVEMERQEPEYQVYGLGFKQVIDAYEKAKNV